MLFSICSSTNCPGHSNASKLQHSTYLLFLHSGFTCILYLHSGSHAFIINVTLCTWVRDIQLSNMWSTMKSNNFSLGVPLLVVTLHGTAPQNTTCNCSVIIIHVLILRCVPVLMNLYYRIKQDFVANTQQYHIRALNKTVLLPFLFCLFLFCVSVCAFFFCFFFHGHRKQLQKRSWEKRSWEIIHCNAYRWSQTPQARQTVLKVCGVIVKTNC